jgi:hypothetical protein
MNVTNPWGRVIQKLMVAEFVEKFHPLPRFMEPESSLLYSQDPVTGPYPEPI